MNLDDEDSRILKDNKAMTIDECVMDELANEEIPVPVTAQELIKTVDQPSLFREMITCLANSKAVFKSQQKDDPDLTVDEKAEIAIELFRKNKPMFLSRFGRFIREDHLHYFRDMQNQDYEIMFHISRLRRYHDHSQRQTDVRNRRYQALKSLIEEGQYFSEAEMMRRNPLLYEHLIGQYLNEEQRKARDNIDTYNITFVNLLLESIERDGTRSLKKQQQEAEKDDMEEDDSDYDESRTREASSQNSKSDMRWGEMSVGESSNHPYEKERNERKFDCLWHGISSKERQVLRDEFTTNMYHSFLNGEDKDFDYSTVDDDESYDNVDLRTQDEEEKYFDSESPETVEDDKLKEREMDAGSSEEDALDKYMRSLQEQPNPNELADAVEKQIIQ